MLLLGNLRRDLLLLREKQLLMWELHLLHWGNHLMHWGHRLVLVGGKVPDQVPGLLSANIAWNQISSALCKTFHAAFGSVVLWHYWADKDNSEKHTLSNESKTSMVNITLSGASFCTRFTFIVYNILFTICTLLKLYTIDNVAGSGTKHRKNCECCPVSLLIVRWQRLSWIQVLNCKNCNQCLNCHKSAGLF